MCPRRHGRRPTRGAPPRGPLASLLASLPPGPHRAPWGPHGARDCPRLPSSFRDGPAAGPPRPRDVGGSGARPISAARLRASRPLHLPPINHVFCVGPYQKGGLISGPASRLDAFSAYPSRTRLPGCALGVRPVHRRSVRPGPLVLGTAPLSPPAPAEDRDRTVSRRSEPSSRTALNGEQPYPWDLLQPQDAMGRHRGAKPSRRCGLLGKISLLSPEYLLSVERRPFHAGPPDH